LPVLIFPGLPFAVALATHKVASVALGIGATIRHLREEPLERRLVMPVLAFGLPGVIIGANVILSVPERAAAYTLILVGVFWNGTGALTLGLPGVIRWSWLPALLLGSLFGGYPGAHLAIRSGNRWIKRAFELVTLLVGLKLIPG
jgi:uncharacterized membrane protein YfcA